MNFVISGFHVLGIYEPGTEPDDINGSLVESFPGAPSTFPKGVNDPLNRVYQSLNPWTLSPAPLNDRVESVNFPNPGRYLVICLFVPHFPRDARIRERSAIAQRRRRCRSRPSCERHRPLYRRAVHRPISLSKGCRCYEDAE